MSVGVISTARRRESWRFTTPADISMTTMRPLNCQRIAPVPPHGALLEIASSPQLARPHNGGVIDQGGLAADQITYRGMNMITRYPPLATLTAAVVSLMIFSPASASEVAQAQEKQPMQGQANGNGAAAAVSDQKIEAFAVAYLQVDKVRRIVGQNRGDVGRSGEAKAADRSQREDGQDR